MIGRPAVEGRGGACRRSCECRDGRVGVLVQADELEVECKSEPASFLAARPRSSRCGASPARL